ncbi:MAG TPA: hypothetical protein DEO84_06060 [candidate division Zixibacteria bacterium]|jgi:hypothetical protein|nr:hypothetical protein [candidate division Zixibacteria bacterium]
MRSIFKTFITLVFLAPMAFGVDISMNMQEMSHISQGTVGALWDICGWYDSQHEKYYVLTGDPDTLTGGMTIVDATDPSNPIFIGKAVDHNDSNPPTVNDIEVVGDYAYVTSRLSDNGYYPPKLWIFYLPVVVQNPDTTNPINILAFNDFATDPRVVPLGDAETIFANDDYLFINELTAFADDSLEVAIFSLENPEDPVRLIVWNQSDFDTGIYGWPHSVYALGTTAYLFNSAGGNYQGGVYKVEFNGITGEIQSWKKIWYDGERGDISDTLTDRNNRYYNCNAYPDPPLPKKPFTHSGWPTADGNYLLVADEHPTGRHVCQDNFAPCLRIFSVNDFYIPQNPDTMTVHPVNAFDIIWNPVNGLDQYIIGPSNIDLIPSTTCPTGDCLWPVDDDTFPVPEPNYMAMGIHDPFVKGKLAFIAWYERGIQVIDLKDIGAYGNPIYQAGYYDHDVGPNSAWHEEAFDVYPYSPDGYIYQGDGQGLYIYRYGYTGNLATNTTWSGDVYIYNTLTVPSGITLTIQPGTKIYAYKDATLYIQGTLNANGTASDSVKFICLGGNPQPGDWYGIYVDTAATCSLSYCTVRYANYGVECRNNSHITVLHSDISNNSGDGIHNYKGILAVDSSNINFNAYSGVWGYFSDNNIYGSRIMGNDLYGIYLSGTRTGSTDSTLIQYDTLYDATNPSDYGISITSIDAVRVYKCKVRYFDQGALYLNNSNALVKNCDFSSNGFYGIYANNYSYPTIRQCRIDTLSIGVKSNLSKPNLGKSQALSDHGNNSFLNCSSYYIYHVYSDTLFAQYDYFGGKPDAAKFYAPILLGRIIYNPYLSSPPPAPRLEAGPALPLAFELRQNYPNPFNPNTTISYSLNTPGLTTLTIYNLLGQKVNTLINEYRPEGVQAIIWDGTNEVGQPVSSGIYFYAVQSGEHFQAKKMTLLR